MKTGKSFLLVLLTVLFTVVDAQQIKGKITDLATGKALEGSQILVQPSGEISISDANGNYTINLSAPGKYKIACSFVGFASAEKEITIAKEELKTIDFQLNEISKELQIVEIKEIATPTRQTGDALFTGTSITRSGIELQGAWANSSIFGTLNILPAIWVESQDPYGLSEKTTRIRGAQGNFTGVTIEGIPNYGVMPIGARDDIYDMENMNTIALYKGATPSDLGSATGSRAGVVELKWARPTEKPGLKFMQTSGTNKYSRTYARIETGKTKTNSKAFISFSHTQADKWKGTGVLADRNNVALGINQTIGKKLELDLFANYNKALKNTFKALTFNQVDSLDKYFELDFNPTLVGNAKSDANYFDYNKGDYENIDLMIFAKYRVTSNINAELKLYYSTENAFYNNTTSSGSGASTKYLVQERTRDLTKLGFTPELNGNIKSIRWSIGYWHENFDNLVHLYNNQITDSSLNRLGYAFYTVPKGGGKIISPYLKIAREGMKFSWQFGLKYFIFKEPEADRYKAATADSLKTTAESDLHSNALEEEIFLPSFGVGYKINKKFEVFANYGKNYMRPYQYVPTISIYMANKAKFQAANMTLQSIFDGWKMEVSNNFDLGLRFETKKLSTAISFYYGKHSNTLATVYDSIVKVNYQQNVGDMEAYGVEFEMYFSPLKSFSLYANPSYTRMYYIDNLQKLIGTEISILELKGKQIPATPVFSIKAGAVYSQKWFTANLRVNHSGERFGVANSSEVIDSYSVFDFGISGKVTKIWILKNTEIGLEVKNLTNSKYVGMINASDDNNPGTTTYFAGSPRTLVASLRFNI